MLEQTEFRQSLLKPMLIFGGEREITLVSILLSSVVAYAGFLGKKPLIILIGIVLCVVMLSVVRMMAKADPQGVKVFMRHIKYSRFYPARSTPWRIDK